MLRFNGPAALKPGRPKFRELSDALRLAQLESLALASTAHDLEGSE